MNHLTRKTLICLEKPDRNIRINAAFNKLQFFVDRLSNSE